MHMPYDKCLNRWMQYNESKDSFLPHGYRISRKRGKSEAVDIRSLCLLVIFQLLCSFVLAAEAILQLCDSALLVQEGVGAIGYVQRASVTCYVLHIRSLTCIVWLIFSIQSLWLKQWCTCSSIHRFWSEVCSVSCLSQLLYHVTSVWHFHNVRWKRFLACGVRGNWN